MKELKYSEFNSVVGGDAGELGAAMATGALSGGGTGMAVGASVGGPLGAAAIGFLGALVGAAAGVTSYALANA